MKNKTGPTVAKAIDKIVTSIPAQLIHCQTDFGSEFYNRHVKQVFAKHNINHYSVYSEMKAALVERFIRTLKEKIYKYFTASNSWRYVDVLADLVHSYNHSVHSSIKMAPAQVDEGNTNTVWHTLYGTTKKTKLSCTFRPGDYVRISRAKHRLQKGYLPKWSREIFIVDQCIKTRPTTYRIKDWNGEPIQGIFYTEELQKIIVDRNTIYLIEKILKRRKGWIFVKWLGFPETMNSWVRRKSVQL